MYKVAMSPGLKLDQENWETYEVSAPFHVGDMEEKLGRGELLKVSDRFVLIRDEHLFRRRVFNTAINKHWITRLVDPMLEEDSSAVEDSTVESRLAKKISDSTSSKRVASTLLPAGWKDMHWKKRVTETRKISSVSLLQNILLEDETPAVSKAVKIRIEELQSSGESP